MDYYIKEIGFVTKNIDILKTYNLSIYLINKVKKYSKINYEMYHFVDNFWI